MGIVGALASLSATAELDDRVSKVVAERERLTRRLTATGAIVPPSRANFVYVSTPGTATRVVAALERRGTVTRAIGDDGVRITVGLPAENDRLVDHWADVQHELGLGTATS